MTTKAKTCLVCGKGRLRFISQRWAGRPDGACFQAYETHRCDHCGWEIDYDVS